MKLKNTELAYLAGLLDGEGCIYIDSWKDKRKAGIRKQFILRVNIANTCEEVIDWITEKTKSLYCGNKSQSKGREFKETKRKPLFVWKISGKNAVKFLIDTYDFLIIKKKRAELGIEFGETKFNNAKQGRKGQFESMPIDLYEKKERIYMQIRELNKTGIQ